MAKEKEDKKPVAAVGEAYRLSAQQLFESGKSRNIITCSLSSDIGLGGGIPIGCTIIIGGKPKSGKTTLSLQYAANAQQQFGTKVFFFNIEGRLDPKVLSQIRNLKRGVEDFEVIMGTPLYDEKGVVVKVKKMAADWWWSRIGETIVAYPGCIIIVDSISALSSEKELSEGMGHQSRGDLQKLEAQFCREFGDMIMPNKVTIFLLAQVQANPSGYGDPLQIKCGNAIRHAADGIIFARGVEKWPEKDGRTLGHDINCRIETSPLGPPWIETKIPLRYGYGIDDLQDLITNASNWDIIKKAGSWLTLPFIDKDGKAVFTAFDKVVEGDKLVKLQGEESIRNWLSIHPEAFDTLNKKLRTIIFGC